MARITCSKCRAEFPLPKTEVIVCPICGKRGRLPQKESGPEPELEASPPAEFVQHYPQPYLQPYPVPQAQHSPPPESEPESDYPSRFHKLSKIAEQAGEFTTGLLVLLMLLCVAGAAYSLGTNNSGGALVLVMGLPFIGIQIVWVRMCMYAVMTFVDMAECLWDIRDKIG